MAGRSPSHEAHLLSRRPYVRQRRRGIVPTIYGFGAYFIEATDTLLHRTRLRCCSCRRPVHCLWRTAYAEAAKAIKHTIADRIKDRSPAPGSEVAFDQMLDTGRAGNPNYEQMSPEFLHRSHVVTRIPWALA